MNMLDFLPDLLEGLFQMVTDPNKEIKMAAEVSSIVVVVVVVGIGCVVHVYLYVVCVFLRYYAMLYCIHFILICTVLYILYHH